MSQLKVNSIVPAGGIPAGADGGGIIQVVQSVRTETETFSLNAGVLSGDLTGLTATITPRSTSNKILVSAGVNCNAVSNAVYIYLYRGGSVVSGATGDAAGSRSRVTATGWSSNDSQAETINFEYLDAPASTSALTYSLRVSHSSTVNRTVNINYSTTDANANYQARAMSYIILMEVSG